MVSCYLANLKHKGNLCNLDEISNKDKPMISGKIVKILPFVKKSSSQPNDILTLHLKEVYSSSDFSRKSFKVIFVAEAAQLLNNLVLAANDHLLFYNPKLTSDASYKREQYLYHKQLVVGLWPVNKIEDFYYKRKNTENWNQLLNHRVEEPISDIYDTSAIPIFSDEDDDDDVSILENSGNSLNDRNSSTFSVNFERNNEQSNNICFSSTSSDAPVPTSSRSIMSNFASVLQVASSSKNCSTEKTTKNNKKLENNRITDINNYTRLIDLKKGMKANIYAIFLKVLKEPTCVENKYEIWINVTDDTKYDDFLVYICSKTIDIFHKLEPYCIIRLHRLSIVEKNGDLGGTLNGGDVLVFDKNDINITYGASSCAVAESDKKRIRELENWMLENIPASRPITKLSDLDTGMMRRKIKLNGDVVDIKVYDNQSSSVVALRIRDGTKCKIPHRHLSLNFNEWDKVLTNSKACYSESDEIDIIVVEPAKNFKTIIVGEKIELYNVEVIVVNEFVKTTRNEYITLNMKGTWDNLKCVTSIVDQPRELICTSSEEMHRPDTLSTNANNHEESIRKRKLFNPEMPVNFESDDSENIDINNKNQNECCEKNPKKKQCKSDNSLGKKNDCDVINLSDNTNVNLLELEKSNTVSVMVPVELEKKPPDKPISDVNHCEEIMKINDLPKETEKNYVTVWPKYTSSDSFNILVNLVTSNPVFDDDDSESDVLSIIKAYCARCFQFFSYFHVKWMHEEGEAPEAFCSKCKAEGQINNLSFLIKFELLLKDRKGDVKPAVILGEYAEEFLGYSVKQIFSSDEIRLKIKEQMEVWKEKPVLAEIIPMNADRSKPKYHVTHLKSFTSFII